MDNETIPIHKDIAKRLTRGAEIGRGLMIAHAELKRRNEYLAEALKEERQEVDRWINKWMSIPMPLDQAAARADLDHDIAAQITTLTLNVSAPPGCVRLPEDMFDTTRRNHVY